jgi:ketosteroid isomerase-like protein
MTSHHSAFFLFGVFVLLFGAPLTTRGEETMANRILEIRSYNLKPGTRDRFHQLANRQAVPMLRRAKIDVVAYGPSAHDANTYFLMRSFTSLVERQQAEDSFYGSEAWIKGPRDAVLAAIETYTTLVISVDEVTLRGLRSPARPAASDLDTLMALNGDYIRSVQQGDVQRFTEILADDFLCSQADGSLLDRAAFLAATARPVTITNLAAHDINVRLMDDFAIVHARTSFTTTDGRLGSGRYTDVWARRGGNWVAVAAHVTRK